MIFHDVTQTSGEWHAMRRGMPTASNFDKIITPKTGKLSAQAKGYAYKLIAEKILGEELQAFPQSYWMERGSLLEAEARQAYEFDTGFTATNGGFITDDTGFFGASPDVLCVDDNGAIVGGAEIKCPAPWTHIENLMRDGEIDPQYMPQVQGQMLIAELSWVDWFSYHPQMPPVRIRVMRDDEYIRNLSDALQLFREMMTDCEARLKTLGCSFAPKFEPKEKQSEDLTKYLSV